MSTEDKKKLAPEAENQLQEQYVQSLQPIEEGQMIPGRVIEVDDDYVYVDVGYKSEGKIPSNEFDTKPQMGETVYVILVRKEGREGQVIVSKRKADEKIFWKDLRIAFDDHKPVQGTIVHKIKSRRRPQAPAGRAGRSQVFVEPPAQPGPAAQQRLVGDLHRAPAGGQQPRGGERVEHGPRRHRVGYPAEQAVRRHPAPVSAVPSASPVSSPTRTRPRKICRAAA